MKRFLILFEGRSGSTHLISHLRSHSQVVAKGEIFAVVRQTKEWSIQRQIMSELYEQRRRRRIRAVGFKTKCRDIADQPAMQRYIARHNISVMHLYRRNPVKWVVSNIRAEALYKRNHKWNIRGDAEPLEAFSISPEEFFTQLKMYERVFSNLSGFVENLKVEKLELAYEDLLADETDSLNRVFMFIGVAPEKTESNVKKNTSDDLSHAVSNLSELQAAFPALADHF